jgi:hypothetical protein
MRKLGLFPSRCNIPIFYFVGLMLLALLVSNSVVPITLLAISSKSRLWVLFWVFKLCYACLFFGLAFP